MGSKKTIKSFFYLNYDKFYNGVHISGRHAPIGIYVNSIIIAIANFVVWRSG